MLDRYEIQFRDHVAEDFGVFLLEYPEFSGGEKSYTTTAVQGRRGQLVGTDNYISNLEISCTFSVISKQFEGTIRRLRDWLSGTGKLKFSGSPDIFYRVWKVEHDNLERELRQYGQFTAIFICDPYEYLESGQTAVETTTTDTIYNPYSVAHPIYQITGQRAGSCTLTVNGKTMSGIVNTDLVVDTERMLAYRQDGTLQNNVVTGNYEDIYLKNGENQISITSTFSLSVIPNWGYEL